MADEFGSVNVRRGAGTREIEILRKHYRDHRDALARLAAAAPSEHLAGEYTRLVRDVDASLLKLDEIERGSSAAASGGTSRTTAPGRPPVETTRPEGGAGARSLIVTPSGEPAPESWEPQFQEPVPEDVPSPRRYAPILIAALVVLGLIGWLIWRASRDRQAAAEVGEPSAVTETLAPVGSQEPSSRRATVPAPINTPVATVPEPLAVSAISVQPASADYGTIHKGTRAVRQFEITNGSNQPIQFQLARSQCRCLYYEYKNMLAPKKKETLTVTVDGAKAKAGLLQETVAVTTKADPSIHASFVVSAVIK